MADQKGPPTSSSAQPVVSFTPRKVYSQLPIPVPMSVEGNLKENRCWFFCCFVFLEREPQELQDSYWTWQEVERVVLVLVLGRNMYQIARNLPVTDWKDPDSLLDALTQRFKLQRNMNFWTISLQQCQSRRWKHRSISQQTAKTGINLCLWLAVRRVDTGQTCY